MSVNVIIKKNGEITIQDIAALQNLCYGVADTNGVLEHDAIGQYTVLYDPAKIGRGFEVAVTDTKIELALPLPTSTHDIETFYALVEKLGSRMGVASFSRDEKICQLSDAKTYVADDIITSQNVLKQLAARLNAAPNHSMLIFGALNPISVTKADIDQINGSLDELEEFLNNHQLMDITYVSPKLYQRADGSLFAVYPIAEDDDTVIPTKPSLLNTKLAINDYYCLIPGDNVIPYADFVANVGATRPYDCAHIIVSLDQQTVNRLAQNFAVDHNTNSKKPFQKYFSQMLIDDGKKHAAKIADFNLDCDALAPYNHLAIFLKWAYQNSILADEFLAAVPELATALAEDTADIRPIICQNDYLNGEIRLAYFTEDAQAFVRDFYLHGTYPRCVDVYALGVFGPEEYNSDKYHNEAYLFVPFNSDYYTNLSQFIDEAWKKFQNPQDEPTFTYTDEQLKQYEQFVADYFGSFTEVYHEIASPDIHLDVIIVPPTAESNYYKLVTMGMGAYKMNVPEDLSSYQLEHAELVIYLPPTWNIKSQNEADYWPIRQLKMLGRMPLLRNTWLGHGHTVTTSPQNAPFAENTGFCSTMLLAALNQNYAPLSCTVDGVGKINFYQLFPLYAEELAYKQQHGAKALLEKFEADDIVPIVNINRKNYGSK